jgi:hypothetical protein
MAVGTAARILRNCTLLEVVLVLTPLAAPTVLADDGVALFESAIRPLLLEHCQKCHSGPEPEGGLSLDSRAGWEEAGVIEPGRPEDSLLVAAIRHEDEDLAMPPPEAGRKLTSAEISAVETWIALGAPDPRDRSSETAASQGPRLRGRKFVLTQEDTDYWAFQPVRRPPLPAVPSGEQAPHPVDALVGALLAERGLSIGPTATPREQVRRAYFDLWGLPPTPEEVAEFEADPSDDRWRALVDRLLASSNYGERWGRHWLDVVRYAESNGYERDGEKPNAWRYRDYVIGSFNDDKPYDVFVREQLAGDELAEQLPASEQGGRRWRDLIVATGFYRLHVWDDEPDSTLAAEFDDLDDVMVTTSAALMGLTVGCARCHDHKFDPISQHDYYALLSFFRGIDPYGQHKTGGGGRGVGRIERELAADIELQQWQDAQAQRVAELEGQLARAADESAKSELTKQLEQCRSAAPPFEKALAVAEIGATPPPTYVLYRGDANEPRELVAPAFPQVLASPPPEIPPRPADARSAGRRTALAEWIASPQNPLTARVMANRVWQHHFGLGIVPTPNDFGRTGAPPTNERLLDFLAAELVEGGWRLKALHRLIMTSRAYRQSSRADNAVALAADSDNQLLWRQNLRRLEAEAIRDSMLSVSGLLNPERGGPSEPPPAAETETGENLASQGKPDGPFRRQARRSVYLAVKRGLKDPLLESLDFANSTFPEGARNVTTTAPQALMLLNDAFVQTQAAALAERVMESADATAESRVTRAFQLVLQRTPTPEEVASAQGLLADQAALASSAGIVEHERRALESFCRGLLNVSEAIYVD